jgi:hypothetical protein
LLIATGAVAVFFAVAVGLFASAWIEAQRDENAWMECDVRTESFGATDWRLRKRKGDDVCVYVDASNRTLREVNVGSGINSIEAVAGVAFVATFAGMIGGIAAPIAVGSIWLVWRFARRRTQYSRERR